MELGSITRSRRKRFGLFVRNSSGWHEFCKPIIAPMSEIESDSGRDAKALLFLVLTLGLAALEVWGLIRLF